MEIAGTGYLYTLAVVVTTFAGFTALTMIFRQKSMPSASPSSSPAALPSSCFAYFPIRRTDRAQPTAPRVFTS
jgi:hypothetical protein